MENTRKKKREEFKRRYDAIKNLMSTFAMSTVAVVAIVTLVPSAPKAEITKTVALSEEIVYQVSVTDEDNALDLSTLFVVLENQLEYYEQPIELGVQSGYFDQLNENTEYRLSIYGSRGFGQERLDTIWLTTRPKVGGTILAVTPTEGIHGTAYTVDVSVHDPDGKYTSVDLYYGYSWEPDVDLTYYQVPLSMNRETIELTDIFSEYPFHLYLEGTTSDGVERLDEIWVTPPFQLYSSIYLAYYNSTEIAFHVYGDMTVPIEYRMNIYNGNLLQRTETFATSPDVYDHAKFLIDGFRPGSTYRLECIAIYTNPITLRQEEQVIYDEIHTTLESYSYTYDIVDIGSRWEVTITLEDASNLFDYVYYETYDTSGDHEFYLIGNTYFFTQTGDTKTVTFEIDKPIVSSFTIYIGMRNSIDTNINHIFDTIQP